MDNIIHGESAFYYDLVKKENIGEMLIGLMQELHQIIIPFLQDCQEMISI